MKDFTLQIFERLCKEFLNRGYAFITFSDYCLKDRPPKFVIMRHDVDKTPENALKIACHEKNLKIKASFYFRVVKGSCNESLCREISAMGHEIGYHYEDFVRAQADFEKAIERFVTNLNTLRRVYPVKTICMHGSPLSKWDNRVLWQKYNYRDFGIVGEPYCDIDFNEILYLTDTGRRWDAADANIRDRVKSNYHYTIKSTFGIIDSLRSNALPAGIMVTIHPHRWNDDFLPWLKEMIWQNTKNIAKQFLVKARR